MKSKLKKRIASKKILATSLSMLMLVGSLLMPSAKKDLKAKEQTSNITVHKQVYTNKAEGSSKEVAKLMGISNNINVATGKPEFVYAVNPRKAVTENIYLKNVQGLIMQQFVVENLTIQTSKGSGVWTKAELSSNPDIKLSDKLQLGSQIISMSITAAITNGQQMPDKTTLTSIMETFAKGQGYLKNITPSIIEKDNAGITIENTGEELDLAQFKVKPYDPDEYGMIRFTLYKIDRNKLAQAKVEPSEIVKNDAYKNYLDESFKPVNKIVNKAGIANFTSVLQGDYVIAETVKPAAVVEPAQPMFVRLPVTNKTNDGFLSTVHLYPKNRIDEEKATITVTKKGLGIDGSIELVPEARFRLFRGKPGQGGQELHIVKTDSNGELKLSKLKPGPYYLVELPADNVDGLSGRRAIKKHFVSPYLLDNSNNKAQIMVQPNGNITTTTDSDPAAPNTLELMNYSTPRGEKELINKSATEYDYNAPIKFKSTFKYNFGDDQKNNGIYGNFRITDELSSEYAKILEDSVEITLFKGLNNNKLVKGEDYSLTVEGHKFTIEFAPSMGKYLNNGSTIIQVDYNAALTEKLEPNTKVSNKTSFLYNIGEVEKELSEGKYTYWTNNGWKEFNSLEAFMKSKTAKMFITASSGELIIRGFEEGNYEVIEVESPEGFDLDQTPIKFKLDANSWDTKEIQKIVNYKSADLPVTGKEWTAIAICSTVALLVVGGVFVLIDKKKKEKRD